MKFSISRSILLDALQSVIGAIASKSTLTILQNVLIDVRKGEMTLVATDLDMTRKVTVDCHSEECGTFTLPAKRLATIVKEVSEGEVCFDVEGDVATIRIGTSMFRVLGLSASDFPPAQPSLGDDVYSLPCQALRDALRLTAYAASEDQTRRVLNGVLLAFDATGLTVVATDGRRLAKVFVSIDYSVLPIKEMIVPSATVEQLLKMLDVDGDVSVSVKSGVVVFEVGKSILASKLIDAVYPNYKQVIPTNNDAVVTVEREALLAALRRVAVITTDKVMATKFTFTKDKLTVEANTPDVGEGRDSVSCKGVDGTVSIVFNPMYVMEALKVIEDDTVGIRLRDGASPAIMESGYNFSYVIMPLRVS